MRDDVISVIPYLIGWDLLILINIRSITLNDDTFLSNVCHVCNLTLKHHLHVSYKRHPWSSLCLKFFCLSIILSNCGSADIFLNVLGDITVASICHLSSSSSYISSSSISSSTSSSSSSLSYISSSSTLYLYIIRNDLGAVSIRKTVLPGMGIPMLKIRRPNGRLIFNMEIAIRK